MNLTINSPASGTDVKTACGSFTWIDGNNYTSSNNTATYTITNGAANGCDSIVTLNLTINTPASGTDVKTACGSFTWIDGNNYTSSNNTATYTITNGAANGCDSIVTLNLTINNISDLTTSINGIIISANNTSATYQWLDCDNNYAIISGESNQTFSPNTNGNYAVQLTENGCVDTSSCVSITTVGVIENNFGNDFVVYPNPSKGNFTIDLGTTLHSIRISISDLTGRIIQSNEYNNVQLLNLSLDKPAGMYFITISSDEKTAVIGLVKE